MINRNKNKNTFLLGAERLSSSNPDHLLNQIQVGNALGDRVLDLQTGVHFQEVEVPLRIDQHLNGTSALVVDSLGQLDSLLTHSLPGLRVNARRGGLLSDLLVSPLDGALSLGQIDTILVLVHEELDFDVTGLINELFDEHTAVTEGSNSLSLGELEGFDDFFIIPSDTKTLKRKMVSSAELDKKEKKRTG